MGFSRQATISGERLHLSDEPTVITMEKEGTGEEEEKKQQVLNEQKYQRPKYWVWAESREHRPGIRMTALLWRQNEDGTGFRVSRSRFVSKRLFICCVNLGEPLNVSEPPFP